MDNTSQQWFKSYLEDRTQSCHINGSLSDALTLTQGVLQESILSPVFFSLHINDLPLAIPNSNVDIYADDTTLWETNRDLLHVQQDLIQDSLNKANSWFSLNEMVLNMIKTKQLVIVTSQKLLHSGNPSLNLFLQLCGTSVGKAKEGKPLGVKIDKHLNWDDHIDYLK